MPELEYFLVSESYSIHRDTAAISIFNVLNQVRAEEMPFVIPSVAVIACWICTPDEITRGAQFQQSITFTRPAEEPLEFRGNFIADTRFRHLVFKMEGLSVNQPGDVRVDVYLNDEYKAHHTIEITPPPAE